MSARKPIPTKTSNFQPWQIALFVAAMLVLGWQVLGFVQQKQRDAEVKYDKGPELKINARETSGRFKAMRDKDEGR